MELELRKEKIAKENEENIRSWKRNGRLGWSWTLPSTECSYN